MTIISYGHKAIADEDRLDIMRDKCTACMSIVEDDPSFCSLWLDLRDEVNSIDIHIAGLRREDRIAEQNAKYREERPNA